MSQYVEDVDFDKNLRLGDIINGFSYILPTFDDFVNKGNEFKLDIRQQQFFSILTPCCSIEDQLITLAPLKNIKYSYLLNPYFKEDLTRINRPMPQDKMFPPLAWGSFTEEKKALLISADEGYTLFEQFYYSSNEKLPKYEIKFKTEPIVSINDYMIDFRGAFTIVSKSIFRGNSYQKVLQLTIKSRGELRNKLAFFFNRIPEEDKIVF